MGWSLKDSLTITQGSPNASDRPPRSKAQMTRLALASWAASSRFAHRAPQTPSSVAIGITVVVYTQLPVDDGLMLLGFGPLIVAALLLPETKTRELTPE